MALLVGVECRTVEDYDLVNEITELIRYDGGRYTYRDFEDLLMLIPGFHVYSPDLNPSFVRVYAGYGEWLAFDVPCRY